MSKESVMKWVLALAAVWMLILIVVMLMAFSYNSQSNIIWTTTISSGVGYNIAPTVGY